MILSILNDTATTLKGKVEPTSVVVVVAVHKGHSHGIVSVERALVGVAAVHCVHHVRHFLPRRSNGVLAFFGQFPVRSRHGYLFKCLRT